MLCRGVKVFNVGIKGKEAIAVVQGSKEFSLHLRDALEIKFQIVPWLRIGDHVPAQRIGAILLHGLKGFNSIAQSLGHFLAGFVQHQPIGDDIFVSHGVKDHPGNGMQGEEPPAGLVHAFCNEVSREGRSLVDEVFVFKGVVHLCIGHGSTVKPHINQVAFSLHGFPLGGGQNPAIHLRAMQIYQGIVCC